MLRRKLSRRWWIHNFFAIKLKVCMPKYTNNETYRIAIYCNICFYSLTWMHLSWLDCKKKKLVHFVHVLLCNANEASLCFHSNEVQEICCSFWKGTCKCIFILKTSRVICISFCLIVPPMKPLLNFMFRHFFSKCLVNVFKPLVVGSTTTSASWCFMF